MKEGPLEAGGKEGSMNSKITAAVSSPVNHTTMYS